VLRALPRRCGLILLAGGLALAASGQDWKTLPGHVPAAVTHLRPVGRVPATNQLHLAIGVPLRDPAGLNAFLAQLYDPASTNYHRYLTPEQFADRFGPTKQDYEAVQQFARSNGLALTGTFGNRLILDVAGPAAAVEQALQVTLRTYAHPSEARQFFAPDTEPKVPRALPVADIQGLSDYVRPHPRLKRMSAARVWPHAGSAPDASGAYFGNDYRNAYAPNTALTGAGQKVGLLQFDGFYASDIATYAAAAGGGRTNIPIQTVLLDGYNGVPTTGANSGNPEVSLDIEMTMSMAPGLAGIVVFEAGPDGTPNDILNAMVGYSGTVKQLSSSWGWGGGPSSTTDAIFQNMAADGQSFFNAAGDSDAFTAGANSVNGVDNTGLANAPSSSPYITQVGGTTLTTGAGAAYASETVWNWGYDANAGGYVGTSGGISSYYPLPSWQTNVSNLAGRGGSSTARNIPDVALTGDNVYVGYGDGASGEMGGTSCAAPLWAGFMALVNQQAAAQNRSSAGFINPAIYALSAGASYAACFHDVTTGNNTWPSSPNEFYATNGYDLCTGLGTPNGQSLINALAGLVDALGISPSAGCAFSGIYGGPFSPGAGVFQLTNSSAASLTWSLVTTSAWLNADSAGGTLAAHATTAVTVSLTAAAATLLPGGYSAALVFSNAASKAVQSVPAALQVSPPLAVSPVKGFTGVGPVGGPFGTTSQTYVLTNLGNGTVNWSLINTSAWLTASAANGALAPASEAGITIGLSSSAAALPAAVYQASVIFSNVTGVVAVVPFTLSVGQPILQNGGFETGDFTDWISSGNAQYCYVVGGSSYAAYIHSGSYAAQLGPYGTPGYLTQNLTTSPGQNYLLSLWVRNPTGKTPNLFQVQWNGTNVFNQSNFTLKAWTNLQFLVTATGSTTSLQLGFQNDPDYFGLDDINVTPLTPVTFQSSVRVSGGFQLSWSTTTGLVYQVQYKTNLLQPNWVNLGSTTTAKANTLTFTDTNAVKVSPQRYYRLWAAP